MSSHADSARSNDLLHRLIRAKVRILLPMVAIYMASYVGLTVLAAFAKDFVARKVIGSLNVGFLLIGANYVLSWILALIYVRVANRIFDPMAKDVAAAARNEGQPL